MTSPAVPRAATLPQSAISINYSPRPLLDNSPDLLLNELNSMPLGQVGGTMNPKKTLRSKQDRFRGLGRAVLFLALVLAAWALLPQQSLWGLGTGQAWALEPSIVGSLSLTGSATGVSVSGDYAYVVDGWALRVIDITSHSYPVLVASWQPAFWVSVFADVKVVGDYAFLADSLYGLWVVDVSNPTNPQFADSYAMYGNPNYIDVSPDGFAVLNTLLNGFGVLDVSDPTDVRYLGGRRLTSGLAYNRGGISSSYYYTSHGLYMLAYMLSFAGSPTRVCTFQNGGATVVRAKGSLTYDASYFPARVTDFTSFSEPVEQGRCNTNIYNGAHPDIRVTDGKYAYVIENNATLGGGLLVVDLDWPWYTGEMNVAVRVALPGMGNQSLDVTGYHAYVAAGDDGLQIVELPYPYSPE